MPLSSNKSDILGVDFHTFKDLGIFESDNDDSSLFECCDRTRSINGAAVLKWRMQNPWASAESVYGLQPTNNLSRNHMPLLFEEIDSQASPLGEISLRRRRIPALGDRDIYDVNPGEELLVSSMFVEAE